MAETKEQLTHESGGMSHEQEQNRETQIRPEGIKDVAETRQRVPNEIKSWLHKIEEDPQNQQSVQDDAGQPMLTPSTPTNPKVQLPTNRGTFLEGFKKTFDDAGKWLSAFVLRLIKKSKGNVKFKEE